MVKSFLTTACVLLCSGPPSLAETTPQPQPYDQPSVKYLTQFVDKAGSVFVYERFDAKGALVQRDLNHLLKPVIASGPTERRINDTGYRLRGLRACPREKVTYQAQDWECGKAVIDYATAVYGRASVVLCKTLVLKSRAGSPDPVSCFALLGAGNAVEPYMVYNDDDAMVFLGLADIAKSDAGRSLRPDLERSKIFGEAYQ